MQPCWALHTLSLFNLLPLCFIVQTHASYLRSHNGRIRHQYVRIEISGYRFTCHHGNLRNRACVYKRPAYLFLSYSKAQPELLLILSDNAQPCKLFVIILKTLSTDRQLCTLLLNLVLLFLSVKMTARVNLKQCNCVSFQFACGHTKADPCGFPNNPALETNATMWVCIYALTD